MKFSMSSALRKNSIFVFLLVCIGFSDFAYSLNTPEFPAIDNEKKIQAIDLNENFTAPFLPSHRTTADGRVAVPFTWGAYFYLNVPEKITGPYINSPDGTDILARNNNAIIRLGFNQGQIIGRTFAPGSKIGMRSICDATGQFPENGNSVKNPRSCGTANEPADCYQFTLVNTYKEPQQNNDVLVELWGREVEVKVNNPKTQEATLASYQWLSAPVKGLTFTLPDSADKVASIMAEPIFTNDGHLLVTRIGSSWLNWPAGSQKRYDVVYSVAPETANACDVTQFSPLKPISHAPYDDEMVGRYGIADQPFRDPEGSYIADGVDMLATYPWVDRRGDNIMVETIRSSLHEVSGGAVKKRFETRCLDGIACNVNPTVSEVFQNGTVEWKGRKRGISLLGRWTKGKMVLLDGLVNSTDFALDYRPEQQREIKLYQPNSGPLGNESAWVNAGVAEHNSIPASLRDKHGIDGNLNFIDSMENLWSYRDAFNPVSFRDVVWLITSGHTTAEVSLDEFMDNDAYIISEMTASQTHGSSFAMTLWDGFNGNSGGFTLERRVQNAATSTAFSVPGYGKLTGDARIEPIAMGGIEGRGVFMEPSDGIEYTIPENINGGQDWIISLFLDPRFANDSTQRRVLTYPDGTIVDLIGLSQLRIAKGGTSFTVNIPGGSLSTKAWNQLAFLVENNGASVSVYTDGFRTAVRNEPSATRFFRMNGVKLTVGNAGAASIRGWVDDFKVLAHGGSPEYMCNIARGTLIGLPDGADANWLGTSQLYASQHHSAIADQLPTNFKFDNYACFKDYSGNNQAYRDNLPNGAVAVAELFHSPEGPVVYNSSRPDSSNNEFCLNCHRDINQTGLDLNALIEDLSISASNDPRRQPLQPLRMVFGHIPANFLFDGAPENAVDASNTGFLLDEYLFPEVASNPVGTARIGDYVWLDTDGDGFQGSSEPGLAGVTVNLLDCNAANALMDTVQSDGQGNYSFDNLPAGRYRLEFVKPNGYDYTAYNLGAAIQDWGSDSDADITTGLTTCRDMADGQNRVGIDTGFVPTGTARMGDYVWLDTDGDGFQGSSEPGLAGVTVNLLDCNAANALMDTVQSDGQGNYSFDNLPAGRYRLEFVKPNGYDYTAYNLGAAVQNWGSDSDADTPTGLTMCRDMADGQNRLGIDAGFVPTGTSGTASMGDYIWLDTNANGFQDSNEPGLPGVMVKLLDCNAANALMDTVQSDGQGNYSFDNLPAGRYRLEFVKPSGYDYTAYNLGAAVQDWGSDSDADTTTGLTTCRDMAEGQNRVGIDAGFQ